MLAQKNISFLFSFVVTATFFLLFSSRRGIVRPLSLLLSLGAVEGVHNTEDQSVGPEWA